MYAGVVYQQPQEQEAEEVDAAQYPGYEAGEEQQQLQGAADEEYETDQNQHVDYHVRF